MRLIVPAEEVALIEVAEVKRGWRSDWRDALEEPIALWDGSDVAETLHLIDRLPEDDLYRCFAPGFGVRLHDEKAARAEVLFCFHCHMALMIDLRDRSRDMGETFDADSDPARELLARFQGISVEAAGPEAAPADASRFTGRRPGRPVRVVDEHDAAVDDVEHDHTARGGVTMAFNTEADVATAERDEWSYSPAVGVGPLRFGMTLGEVVEAAEIFGRTEVGECVPDHAIFAPTWKIEVCLRSATLSLPAITTYVSQAVGLFCIVADAAHGPQVVHDGVRLVGRDLSELESEVIAYAEADDLYMRYAPEGYAGPDDPGIIMRGQRVGSGLRSRPLFAVTRDGANTEWDSMPHEEYRMGLDALRGMPLDGSPQPDVV